MMALFLSQPCVTDGDEPKLGMCKNEYSFLILEAVYMAMDAGEYGNEDGLEGGLSGICAPWEREGP